jgi:hypothetical protein
MAEIAVATKNVTMSSVRNIRPPLLFLVRSDAAEQWYQAERHLRHDHA